MMRKKKGQIAMEHLFTYGLVFMTVMAVAGVLYVYGKDSSKNVFPAQCIFLAGLECMDSVVLSTDNGTNSTIVMHIKNELGFDIYNISIQINGTCDSTNILNGSEAGSTSLTNLESDSYGFGCQDLHDRYVTEVIAITFNSLQTGNSHRKTGSMSYDP